MFVSTQSGGAFEHVTRDKWIKFSAVYLFSALIFICPPRPFVEMGVTVQGLFGSWIGNSHDHYVYHHIRRSYATVVVHALIALGYLAMTASFFGQAIVAPVAPSSLNPILAGDDISLLEAYNSRHFSTADFLRSLLWWAVLLTAFGSIGIAELWRLGGWKRHPIVKELQYYNRDWHAISDRIASEYRRLDNLFMSLGGQQVVVTNSWILSATTYTMYFAHQNDVDMSIIGSQDVTSIESRELDQILTIRVTSVRKGSRPFTIRLESAHFEELQLKVATPVRNMKSIMIRQSVSEQFVQAFKEQVAANGPPVQSQEELDRCVSCMSCPASVRIAKMCIHDPSRQKQCSPCMCRPMWCIECLGKWFASKQDQNTPEMWMEGQADCPTCQAVFCMHDVISVAYNDKSL